MNHSPDWDGAERRKINLQIETDIALIKQHIGFIIEKTDSILEKVENMVNKKLFEDHVLQDRWILGISITMLLGILLKLFF